MLTKILESLGVAEEETKIYLYLLENGEQTAGNLAKKIHIPRSSLYGLLKNLENIGVVGESSRPGIKIFAAESPEKITLLLEEKIENLEKQKTLLESLMPDLMHKKVSKLLKPKIQFFEGAEGVRHVLKDMLLYSNLETQAFWPIKDMLEALSPDFFRYLNKERIKSNLYTRAIWPQDKMVDIKKHPYLGVGREFKREIRTAPKGMSFQMGYWMYGHKTAFLSSTREGFGFIIESTELAEMLRAQFELVWNLSEPIVVNKEDTQQFLEELKKY